MHSLHISLVMCVIMAISAIGHPAVSHPRIPNRIALEANEVEDLYAQFPNEHPLHTTILMAQHAHPTAAAGSVAMTN
jgi:hypothetical protein